MVLAGNRFWLYILLCTWSTIRGVVLVIWFWRGIVFGVMYVLSVQYRSLLRPEKKVLVRKKSSSHLSGRCAIVVTTGKKSSSRLSGGLCCCVSFWFWREIGSVFVVAGKFYYDRKKKVLVVRLAGCAVVSVFGSGGKSAFFSL